MKNYPFLLFFVLLILGGCKEVDTPPPTPGPGLPTSGKYVLPYPVTASYLVLQGNNGIFSHTENQRYAWDFRMEIGTIITASRSGEVRTIKEDVDDGDHSAANYIIISHGDNTFSRYLHLTRDGALVNVGDKIAQGDTIALSGNTGFSTEPHLHFDVTNNFCTRTSNSCPTMPIRFSNSSDPVPRQGQTYVAREY